MCPTSSIIRANMLFIGQINSIASYKHKHFKENSVLELKKKSAYSECMAGDL